MGKNRIGVKILLSAVFILSAIEQGNSMKARRTYFEQFQDAFLSRNEDQINFAMMHARMNVNMVNCHGRTVLHNLVGYPEYIDIVELLLNKYYAEVNTMDNDGVTPLHEAAESGYLPMVELLVAHGAIINVLDKLELTPLNNSASKKIYEFLIQSGAKEEVDESFIRADD
jgi:ankyrin repeat protein